MSKLLFISLILVYVLGWVSRWLFRRVVVWIRSRRPVVVAAGESGIERYQRYKAGLLLKPIEPPLGTSPEAIEHFRKLSPLAQRQAVEARKRLRLDG